MNRNVNNSPCSKITTTHPKATFEEIRKRQQYILNCRNRPVSKNLINAITNANISLIQPSQPVASNNDISSYIAAYHRNPIRFFCPRCNQNLLLDHYPRCTKNIKIQPDRRQPLLPRFIDHNEFLPSICNLKPERNNKIVLENTSNSNIQTSPKKYDGIVLQNTSSRTKQQTSFKTSTSSQETTQSLNIPSPLNILKRKPTNNENEETRYQQHQRQHLKPEQQSRRQRQSKHQQQQCPQQQQQQASTRIIEPKPTSNYHRPITTTSICSSTIMQHLKTSKDFSSMEHSTLHNIAKKNSTSKDISTSRDILRNKAALLTSLINQTRKHLNSSSNLEHSQTSYHKLIKNKDISKISHHNLTNDLSTPQRSVQNTLKEEEVSSKKVSPIIIKLNKLKEKRKRHRMMKNAQSAIVKKKKTKKKKRKMRENVIPTQQADPSPTKKESVTKYLRHKINNDITGFECDPINDIDLTSFSSATSEDEDEDQKLVEKIKDNTYISSSNDVMIIPTISDVKSVLRTNDVTSQSNDVVEMSSNNDVKSNDVRIMKSNDEIEKGISLDDVGFDSGQAMKRQMMYHHPGNVEISNYFSSMPQHPSFVGHQTSYGGYNSSSSSYTIQHPQHFGFIQPSNVQNNHGRVFSSFK